MKHTIEHNQKISNSMKGKNTWMKGRHLSIETRNKISVRGKGKKHSLEWNKKVSESNKGKKRSDETKKRMSESALKNPRRYWLGKSRTSMLKEKHFNWKGGISKDVHSIAEPKYKKWRSDVFNRDNWTCQTCGIRGVYLEAHHIKSWSKFPELRYILENGVALCRDCHKLTDNYKGKK